MQRSLLCAALCVSQLSPLAIVQPEPAPPAAVTREKKERPPIYDEKADAKADIAAAVTKAGKENQRVLIQWGANWCGWCHLLHGTFKSDPAIAKELMYEYRVVLVDVGQFDKNIDLATSLGADLKANGLPYLTVLGSDGKPIANQETGALESADKDKPSHDGVRVLAFLKKNQATPMKADDILAAGLKEASSSGRRVFLHFGAPWCGWCHRLEDWMAGPAIAAILGKDLVDVKIDVDRTVGGNEILAKYRGPKEAGIPWFVVLDASNAASPVPLADSNAPKTGNIGFPSEPAEIEHFIGMMKKAAVKMTPADIEALKASLSEKEKPAAGSPASVPMTPMTPLSRPERKE